MIDFIRDYGLILILFILPVIFALQPLFLPRIEKMHIQLDVAELKRKKLLIYRQIKELEMEYDIGNINENDFISGRATLKKEVSEVIAKLKSL